MREKMGDAGGYGNAAAPIAAGETTELNGRFFVPNTNTNKPSCATQATTQFFA